MGSSETVHYWRVRRTNIENTKFQNSPKYLRYLIMIHFVHFAAQSKFNTNYAHPSLSLDDRGEVREIVAEGESGLFLPLTRDNVSKWKDFNTFLVMWESESDYVRKWKTKKSLLKLDLNLAITKQRRHPESISKIS